MTKPTPGPWSFNAKLSASENHRGFTIRAEAGWVLADVIPVDEGGVEGKANARLIASAPDLLRIARAAAEIGLHADYLGHDCMCNQCEMVRAAQSVIRRIEGGE